MGIIYEKTNNDLLSLATTMWRSVQIVKALDGLICSHYVYRSRSLED